MTYDEAIEAAADESAAHASWVPEVSRIIHRHLDPVFVAEHRADATEPITDDRLRGFGFVESGNSGLEINSSSAGPVFTLEIDLEMGCDGCQISQGHGRSNQRVLIRMPETVGELIALCRALGIELKETP